MRLIDADALIAEMHNVILEDGEDRRIFYEVIERQSTIEEQKIGKWTQILNADKVTHDYRCSECHRYRFHNGEMLKKYNFCPNCGADMRGEDDEAD